MLLVVARFSLLPSGRTPLAGTWLSVSVEKQLCQYTVPLPIGEWPVAPPNCWCRHFQARGSKVLF